MEAVSGDVFLGRLLGSEIPGADEILAFYDSRADAICTDGKYLFIPLSDHLCHRGDALFESISVRGGIIYELDAHLDRLRKGGESFMQLRPPCSWEQLRRLLVDVVRAGGEKDCSLKIFLGRGCGGFGVSPLECPTPSLYVVCLRQSPASPQDYERGVSAFSSKVPPKQAYLATIKNTNYLPNVLMAREAEERGMDVAVTFHEDGSMGEAAVANIGIVNEQGELLCPPLDRILAGTSMLCAMRLAKERMNVRFANVTKDDLLRAREILLFSSSKLCMPVTSFDGVLVNSGKPGTVAKWLLERMQGEMISSGVKAI